MVGIDNTQAMAAIKNGCSKKLKALNTQHRVSIGALNELHLDPEAALELEYVKTDIQKGDSFTKTLGPQAFVAARDKLGMKKPQSSRKEATSNSGVVISPTRKTTSNKGKG